MSTFKNKKFKFFFSMCVVLINRAIKIKKKEAERKREEREKLDYNSAEYFRVVSSKKKKITSL